MSTAVSRPASAPRGRAVQSVDRALVLLEVLAREPAGLRLGELGQRVGLPVQTVQSLLRTLQLHALVVQAGRGAPYRADVDALLRLATPGASRQARAQRALPILRPLAAALRETVLLVELSGTRAVTIVHLPADQPLAVRTETETFTHLHTMATGKVLAAALPEAAQARLLARLRLPPQTPRTIVDPAALARHLAEVRAQGFAECRDEAALGIAALAVPVRDAAGRALAALGVCLPTVRYTAVRRTALRRRLQQAATRLARAWATRPGPGLTASPATGSVQRQRRRPTGRALAAGGPRAQSGPGP